ncbi:RNA-splicing ligase RtcB [candidate division WOR-3 bacterium RBG_13_43_14]|uniref:tRNA-splicing ligase RtcB n=1 Tax=candidate division WOR-3 bacterium RBG_13_43_14 TaxID=1802590 RepID=A0A1F4UF77_UNCW3|nr:MAG: RNA-splicing ligase RtcB [candidate division WOR-3 bacterium RBG_13_43_14]
MNWHGEFIKLDDNRYKIPKEYKSGMLTDGIIYSSDELLNKIKDDQAPEQVANVAMLPGIVGNSLAMPDIHWGYGFPIGGVAAFDSENGIISPGGVGYDINCGVRLLRTDLTFNEIKPKIEELVRAMFTSVPSGVGSTGKIRIDEREVKHVLVEGANWALKHGYGWSNDIDHIEENGALAGADPEGLSKRVFERGRAQLGTLGAGNHFLEIQVVENIYDQDSAKILGIDQINQIVIMIHTGSRGLGYQICDESVRMLRPVTHKYGIAVPDQQLACAPIDSPEGKKYFAHMACAANYAWANRQCIMHWVRESFEKVLGKSAENLGLYLIYDVAHNIAKFEEYEVSGKIKKLCVHRKGATRAFPPGHPDIPSDYQAIGQPVLIPGDMGSYSYLLLGTDRALKETFGSTCHGAGRQLSRTKALERTKGRHIASELAARGIFVLSASSEVLREEVPEAYKNVDQVVDAVTRAGISRKIVRMRPVGVVKG